MTGHHASLYPGTTNLFDVCVDKAVKTFMAAGVPAEKLIVGVPFYARHWKGVKEAATAWAGKPERWEWEARDMGSLPRAI